MPPRIRLRSKQLQPPLAAQYVCRQCRCASLASATTPAPSGENMFQDIRPIARFPPTQPPSYKPPEFRKTQLHRQYQSLLRSSPLLLIFQHNNLKAGEWMAVRRELDIALRKIDEELANNGDTEGVSALAKLQVIQTGIFASALKVVEFWEPKFANSTDLSASNSAPNASNSESVLSHGLSKQAWESAKQNRELRHGLEPLLSGPIALFTLPKVSTRHLQAALSILAPSTKFPAPKRKANPNYYEPAVQLGLQKLMLLGARVEGTVFDTEGTKWVGSIQGGLEGLRAQLLAALQSVSAGVTNTLESAGRSLYITVEGRRGMLEEDEKPKDADQ